MHEAPLPLPANAAAARRQSRLWARVHAAWPRTAAAPARAAWVPGRVELLGKHTDYAGGRSLLCALDRGFCLLAAPRADGRIRIHDATRRSTAVWTLPPAASPRLAPRWAIYPGAVIAGLRRDDPAHLSGADVVFAGDLPSAAGLSSSSALVVASFLALSTAPGLLDTDADRARCADYLAALERGGAGTEGGSQDHVAILCARAGEWSAWRFRPLQCEATFAAPASLTLVIAVSGVVAAKAGAARARFNRAAAQAAALLELCRQSAGAEFPTLAVAARALGAEAVRRALQRPPVGFTSAELRARFDQFWFECETLVPAATEAAARGDWPRFGALVAASHAAAASGLQNQVPETDALVALARGQGAVAASSFGAGFGGAVWALVEAGDARRFRRAWQRAYRARFAARASRGLFFESAAGPAARLTALGPDRNA